MKKLLAALLAAGTLFVASTADAEIQTYTGQGSYIMNEGENLGVAKERAKADAMRNACEQAGTFVESTTHVANMMVTKDEIVTMTGGIVKLLGEPTYAPLKELENLEGVLIKVTVQVQIDSDDVLKWLNRSTGERSELVAQNKELQAAIDEQDKQIAELKRRLAAAESGQQREQITEQIAAADKTFMANQKLEEALRFYYAGNLNGAMSACTEAIAQNPNIGLAYSLRGTIYYQVGQYQNAIADLTKAAVFSPTDEKIFYNRALAHIKLQDYRRAAEDLSVAIQLNPTDADAYYNRALCYQRLRNFVQYNADLAKARSLGYSL